MIVVSLLLITVAVILLAVGLWQLSSVLLSGSIAASLLAAIMLLAGGRRSEVEESDGVPGQEALPLRRAARHGTGSRRAARGPDRQPPAGAKRAEGAKAKGKKTRGMKTRGTESVTVVIPTQSGPTRAAGTDRASIAAGEYDGLPADEYDGLPADEYDGPPAGEGEDEDPPDEPAPQQVSAADAARVGRMVTEVLVVDGRPRYHLPGCVHLLGREYESLPVSEAVELGFTPCSLCEPDSALLADARRV